MNHAITIGELLLSLGVLIGLGVTAFGLLSAFANMMADAAGDNGKEGCQVMLGGVALLIGCILGLVL